MLRIALVRGHHLSKEETLSYEPLKNDFEFVCFSSTNPWFDHSEIAFPIVRIPSVEGLMRFLPGNIGNRIFGSLDNVLGSGQWMYGLEKHLKGFDIVHTSDYCHFFSYQAARARRKLGYKLVAIHYDNIPFARENKPVARKLKYTLYREADGLFAMSERARQALLLEGVDEKKIFVIGNAVDTEKFAPDPASNAEWRKRFGLAPDDLVILFVGRVRASKGIFELVYATKKLVSDPDVDRAKLRVVVAGKGPRAAEVRTLVRRLGLQDTVKLVGAVPHSQVHHLHNIADIFTLPSIPRKYWQEQFGIVLIESMACAKPIVTTLSGSIPDVVGDAALLVQPNDHYALYSALKQLVTDPSLRNALGRKSRERALACYSPARVAGKLKTAYTSIAHAR